MIYELVPRYSSRKSFYGKAQIEERQEIQDCMTYTISELYSYGTLVARITKNEETCLSTCEYLGHYSMTTTTHQKEFFKQFGLTDYEIKKVIKEGVYEINEG